ncbi:unnamed protein product [Gongylonema pulchrum]|uniref:Acyl_transf_3 domain-containing protein n=1 Tax=Gongylonema pulchrum TaxID=637853 RepID=A0A183CVN9_9BILA|nr:unnamed protein product [Gongylonema pulchrum]
MVASASADEKCSTRHRKVLFQYPALPKFELRLYIVVVCCAAAYAWSEVLIASNKFEFKFGKPASLHHFPLIGDRFKDESNWEWSRWSPLAFSLLPFLIMHSVIFNIGSELVSEDVLQCVTIIYSILYSTALFTSWLVFVSLLQGTFIFLATHYIRRWFTVWISSLPILYFTMHRTLDLSSDPFLVLVFVSYTLLSYISYNLEAQAGRTRPEDNTVLKRYIRMLFYTYYPPYMISLVVVYPEFERQMRERRTRFRDWQKTIFLAIKIGFWWFFTHFILYFMYFEGMLYDLDYARSLPKNEFVTLGMALGVFFHLKYVVIFGVPRVFALADNMQPADGPICIARVTLYSKIWRCFDRGLYSFFKRYIFIPICAPTFSVSRKIFGVLVSYGFVLLWHGFYHQNIVRSSIHYNFLLLANWTMRRLFCVQSPAGDCTQNKSRIANADYDGKSDLENNAAFF